MPHQRTLRHEIHFSGIGLHIGKQVNLLMKPAPANTGIVFRRVDIPGSEFVRAIYTNVSDGKLATTLGTNGIAVNTVEHLLAALAGIGIDNAFVELDGPELPILDGSAAPFVSLLQSAQVRLQNALKRYIVIKEPIRVYCDDKFIEAYPADHLVIDYTIDFDHPLLENQSYSLDFSYANFAREICPARTFCFLKDVEVLRANGFAQGGSLENAVVIGKDGILNPEGLRFPDEFVRHKILDFIGDISLLGHPLIGYIHIHKSGHSLNHQFVREILTHFDKWNWGEAVAIQRKWRVRNVPSIQSFSVASL